MEGRNNNEEICDINISDNYNTLGLSSNIMVHAEEEDIPYVRTIDMQK